MDGWQNKAGWWLESLLIFLSLCFFSCSRSRSCPWIPGWLACMRIQDWVNLSMRTPASHPRRHICFLSLSPFRRRHRRRHGVWAKRLGPFFPLSPLQFIMSLNERVECGMGGCVHGLCSRSLGGEKWMDGYFCLISWVSGWVGDWSRLKGGWWTDELPSAISVRVCCIFLSSSPPFRVPSCSFFPSVPSLLLELPKSVFNLAPIS